MRPPNTPYTLGKNPAGRPTRKDSEHVAKCVNSHDKLIATLEECLRTMELHNWHRGTFMQLDTYKSVVRNLAEARS